MAKKGGKKGGKKGKKSKAQEWVPPSVEHTLFVGVAQSIPLPVGGGDGAGGGGGEGGGDDAKKKGGKKGGKKVGKKGGKKGGKSVAVELMHAHDTQVSNQDFCHPPLPSSSPRFTPPS